MRAAVNGLCAGALGSAAIFSAFEGRWILAIFQGTVSFAASVLIFRPRP